MPAWLPLAVAAGSLAYAIYLALAGRRVRGKAGPGNSLAEASLTWPSETDQRYFESELQLASVFVELAQSTAVYRDAVECRARARGIHVDLGSWIRANGGNGTFEKRLEHLLLLVESDLDRSAHEF